MWGRVEETLLSSSPPMPTLCKVKFYIEHTNKFSLVVGWIILVGIALPAEVQQAVAGSAAERLYS